MPSKFAEIVKSNQVHLSGLSSPPVAVIVGGTSGIGQGMAEVLARHRNGQVHLIIVGRNQDAASKIFAGLPKTDEQSSWTREFVKCDVTLMRNVHAAAQEILSKHDKINYLVLSTGFLATKRIETAEGNDAGLCAFYYSRWKFIDELLPALRKATEAGEEARILSVLAAGYGGVNIPLDNLGWKTFPALSSIRPLMTTYNDLMIAVGDLELLGPYFG